MKKKNSNNKTESFEKTLFKAANKLRKNMDAAEYKHIVLGLIFLKYISDSFEELYAKIKEGKGDFEGANPEDADEYRAENVFFVPQTARWSYLHSRAMLPSIGKDVDDAMEAIEKENATLKGILPKVYARPNLDKTSLGGLINMLGNIALGDEVSKSKDILGRVYEYFLGEFAMAEGKKGGQFYTPKSIVQLLVNIIEPYKGRVYDPCCGSGGMFVMSEKLVREHQGKVDDISIFGQESNQTTYRLARMNLAIRGIDGSQVKWNTEGSFLKDLHPDLKADYILANPPFNDSDWSGELLQKDGRWKYGVPPVGSANFAWVQHFIYHLAPNGIAGFVLSNVSLSSTSSGEDEIRKNIIQNDLVDCIITLPEKLFYNTGIPACIWIINRNKQNQNFRQRKDEILLINAKQKGTLLNRKNRELSMEEIEEISKIYHNWRNKDGKYEDILGFCKAVKAADVLSYKAKLLPGLHTGIKLYSEEKISFEERVLELVNSLNENHQLIKDIEKNTQEEFKKYGYKFSNAPLVNSSPGNIQEIVQELYRNWFIDFNFPNSDNKPYKIDGGKFKETEMGLIPENWNTGEYSHFAESINRSVNQTDKEKFDKYVALEDMPRKRLFINKFSSVDDVTSSMIEFKENEILFGSMRPYFHKICVAPFNGITRTTTFVIKPKKDIFHKYLLMLTFQKYTVDYADSTSEGSTIPYAVFESLEKMPVIIPDDETLTNFENLLKPLIQIAKLKVIESLKLVEADIVSKNNEE
jgi:type I restriction enzyme M protein